MSQDDFVSNILHVCFDPVVLWRSSLMKTQHKHTNTTADCHILCSMTGWASVMWRSNRITVWDIVPSSLACPRLSLQCLSTSAPEARSLKCDSVYSTSRFSAVSPAWGSCLPGNHSSALHHLHCLKHPEFFETMPSWQGRLDHSRL